MTDSSDDDGFIGRWSRRKRQARVAEPERPAGEPAATDAASGGMPTPAVRDDPEGDPEVVARLPDIDSLDMSSDFTVFLRKGVPDILRRKALRKLWRLDPVFANLDGLNNYDEDYSKLGMVPMPDLKTVYRVGRGMVLAEEDEAEGGGEAAATVETPEDTAAAASAQDSAEASAGAPSETAAPGADAPEPPGEAGDPSPEPGLDKPTDATGKTTAGTKRSGGSARSRRWGGFTS